MIVLLFACVLWAGISILLPVMSPRGMLARLISIFLGFAPLFLLLSIGYVDPWLSLWEILILRSKCGATRELSSWQVVVSLCVPECLLSCYWWCWMIQSTTWSRICKSIEVFLAVWWYILYCIANRNHQPILCILRQIRSWSHVGMQIFGFRGTRVGLNLYFLVWSMCHVFIKFCEIMYRYEALFYTALATVLFSWVIVESVVCNSPVPSSSPKWEKSNSNYLPEPTGIKSAVTSLRSLELQDARVALCFVSCLNIFQSCMHCNSPVIWNIMIVPLAYHSFLFTHSYSFFRLSIFSYGFTFFLKVSSYWCTKNAQVGFKTLVKLILGRVC